MNELPQVFVTVGTDHHPFDRVIAWVDEWLAGGASERARCLVQVGTSRPPQHAEWSSYLTYDVMSEHLRSAVAVVCHGGPATIMEARDAGHVPIVVPRRRELGEHVDDHQVAFATRLGGLGELALADSAAELHALLDRALADPASFRLPVHEHDATGAIRRFGELVEPLLAPRRGRSLTARGLQPRR